MTIQTVHALEGHSHGVCVDFTTHIHETDIDCEIDQFQFASFDFTINEVKLNSSRTELPQLTTYYTSREYHRSFRSNKLRGPPSS